jgi:squalene-hopene/tetraprenyl-beta-curcumene cyclase
MRHPRGFGLAALTFLLALGIGAPAQDGKKLKDDEFNPKLKEEDTMRLSALQPRINEAIEKGTAYLKRIQNRDGSWSAHFPWVGDGHMGITALCTYTLIKSGVPLSDPSVRRGLIWLTGWAPTGTDGKRGAQTTALAAQPVRKQEIDYTYDAGVLLMCLAATKDKAYLPQMQQVLDTLVSFQQGVFSYKKTGTPDMSNTQYAGLGLRAAALEGLIAKPDVYKKLYEATGKYQEAIKWVDRPPELQQQPTAKAGKTVTVQQNPKMPVGGIRYHLSGESWEVVSSGSMTCGGITTLEICRLILQGRLEQKADKELRERVEAGVNWLALNWSVAENPGRGGAHHLYYLYGLERVGSILDIEYIGPHPWYVEGAEVITSRQGGDGAWNNEEDTCFAILFLKRATRVSTGGGRGIVQAGDLLYTSEDPDAEVHLRARGNAPMEVWVSNFPDPVKKAFGTGAGPVKGLRVAKVEYYVDDKLEQTVNGNPRKGWGGDRYPTNLSFASRGEYTLVAKVHLVDPNGPEGDTKIAQVIQSKPIKVRIAGVFEDWMAVAADARRRDLLLAAKASKKFKAASSSSQSKANEKGEGGTEANRALDGMQCTYWACAPDDKEKEPWISFEVQDKAGVTAQVVTLGQIGRRLVDLGNYDRIKKVAISINDGKPFEAEMAADELRPTRVLLPQPVAIKKLGIKIVEREPGKQFPGVAGFTEIGLEAADRAADRPEKDKKDPK